ncbi:MAG: hypothetical protein ACM3PW_15005, partial [Chlamydiota bacterium]
MATEAPGVMIAEMPPPQMSSSQPCKRMKKKLVRRTGRDRSQALRRGFQFAFLGLNVYLGALFYFWVRAYETGSTTGLARPAGVEGYLPIAGMMNFKYWLLSGKAPAIHPAAMFLL